MENLIQLRKKICLLGDAAVGKTSLIHRFVYNQFNERYITTIGTNVSKKELNVALQNKDKNMQKYSITLAIWDIIGQRGMESFNSNYFRNSNGGMVVCDITREETLTSLDSWVASFLQVSGKVPLVFLVNKSDLKKQVAFDLEELGSIAKLHDAPYFATSALTGENVEHSFHTLGKLIV